MTYLNTASFVLFLAAPLARKSGRAGLLGILHNASNGQGAPAVTSQRGESASFLAEDSSQGHDARTTGSPASPESLEGWIGVARDHGGRLSIRETVQLSFEFCLLWFAANFSVAAGLKYTSVASSTILVSTSSAWTLLLGALLGAETFTSKKLCGVLISLLGVSIISRLDFTGETDKNRGSFPHKSAVEVAMGDILSLGSAILYGVYSVLIKKRIRDESRIDVLLFLGFVGAINTFLLWPGMILLHVFGVESFELPPSPRVWTIIIVSLTSLSGFEQSTDLYELNSIISLVSDLCWAYAMLLTSPLVVTVGLSLSIPLALVGQMLLNAQSSSFPYWIGATLVFLAFLLVNQETKQEPRQG